MVLIVNWLNNIRQPCCFTRLFCSANIVKIFEIVLIRTLFYMKNRLIIF